MESVIVTWQALASSPPSRESRRLSKRGSWAFSFLDADPRRQILEYFMPGDERGPSGLLQSNRWTPSGNATSTFFSVWRPTSLDAIRMMIEGKATGKGLNVKGKSAKSGVLSGFVPYLQISEEKHKTRVGTSPAYAAVRIFYASEALRDAARAALQPVLEQLVAVASSAQAALQEEKASGVELDDETKEGHLQNLRYQMTVPEIVNLDDSGYGLEMPERLMFEAYVMRQDISHPPGWETGRPSEPDYMDMNMMSSRKFDPEQPKVVVYQKDDSNPMNPRGLLVAYEEGRKVLPVASDFDAFLFGSTGVEYPAMPDWQLPFLDSLLNHVENIISRSSSLTWTHRWLEVLKGEVKLAKKPAPAAAPKKFSADTRRRRSSISGSMQRGREDGRYGFGDDISRAMIEHACAQLNGAVRHAAECFNYYWPQEMDEEFLVVWDGYSTTKWRYLSPAELRTFLIERAAEGFAFPLNPTWILRDEGWYDVFVAMEKEPKCKPALDAWFPPSSGLRERIHAIHAAFPEGFVRTRSSTASEGSDAGASDFERAQLSLKRYKTLRRAKLKIRVIFLFNRLARESAYRRLSLSQETADDDDGEGHMRVRASQVILDDDEPDLDDLDEAGADIQGPAGRPSWCLSA